MAPLISANTSNAIYLTEEEGGQIAANTPNGIDLGNLTEGTDYIYFEDITLFQHALTYGYESENFAGWKTWSYGAGKIDKITLEAERGRFTIEAWVDNDTAEKTKILGKLHNRLGCSQLYLLRQIASTTFSEFPNAAGTLKKYSPVIVLGVKSIEQGSIYDNQKIQVACEEVWTS